MNKFYKRLRTSAIAVPFLIGVCGLTMGAAIGVSWKKSEVIPVVIVKPSIGGFEPAEGNSIGNIWPKPQVKPVLLVKPSIGSFVPREGISIGNTWRKEDVLPVMLVEPSPGGFIPLRLIATGYESIGDTSQIAPSIPSVIESKIDGDFEGWEGETIVKLMNGQIWQQSEYYYHYHYAFMPDVLIYKSGARWKMKVEGVDRAVGVQQLR
ncbi:MAG: hypothetical protein AB1656_23595 [Candidatus Omnitrophota bacterium]